MNNSTIPSEDTVKPVQVPTYFMIALRGLVAMPTVTMSFDVAREKSMTALNRAIEKNENIFLASQKRSTTDNPGPKDIARIGCICRIKQVVKLPNNVARVMVVGLERAKIASYTAINPCFEVETQAFLDRESDSVTLSALKELILAAYRELIALDAKIPKDLIDGEDEMSDAFCYKLADSILKTEDKIDFLTEETLQARMENILIGMNTMLEMLRVERKIEGKVRRAMEKSQKEYYLREQAKAIHEELGDGTDDLAEYAKKAESLTEEPRQKVEKEIQRMQRMSPTSPEAGVSRSYIEWLLELPWTFETKDNGDLSRARAVLDDDHFSMDKVKERILEYIAVMTLTKKIRGPILCFVGPPGVGKTSIVRSIARALDRKFVAMSLGGVKDEAEIRGHRRTYIGSIPGGIIYHMKQAGCVNPVFLLDEIDKMSSDYRGDPAAAMLEVLDPEQNNHFRDHYLEVAYDLSKVLFVTTANTLDTIPAPLLDRMEVIELSGYTEDDKVQIAQRYLVKKQKEANGLSDTAVEFSDDALRKIIFGYTRESGVRGLERLIGTVCRKIVCGILEDKDNTSVSVTVGDVEKYLGIPKFIEESVSKTDQVGEALGLAWTSVGGTLLPIEVALMSGGKGEIILTGKLGDVMKESARTAISVVRSHAETFGIDAKRFETTDIHIHVPEGATPKDGPSAGITIATAILSAFTDKPVDHSVAMTGEITLRGKVLPIGGLREKLLAAERMGIKTVIIPKRNEKDLGDLPQKIKKALKIKMADDVTEVFAVAIKEK